MSRVGRLPIAIPADVTVTVTPDNVVTVKGPKGELVKTMHSDISKTRTSFSWGLGQVCRQDSRGEGCR